MAVAAGVGALMEKPLDLTRLLKTMQDLLADPVEVRSRRLCGHVQDARPVPSASARFFGGDAAGILLIAQHLR